jgi:acyl carrier protein
MFEELKGKIADVLNIDAEKITEDSRLIEDLKADSMDVATLLIELEGEYGIEIEEEDLDNLKTVKDIVAYIEAKK